MITENPHDSGKRVPVSVPEHTALVKRVCSAISAFFEPTKIPVHQVEISEEVLARSAAEVLARVPSLNRGRKKSTSEDPMPCDSKEESAMLTR